MNGSFRHFEDRKDAALQSGVNLAWIVSLRSQ
jgi:hypothetical protein